MLFLITFLLINIFLECSLASKVVLLTTRLVDDWNEKVIKNRAPEFPESYLIASAAHKCGHGQWFSIWSSFNKLTDDYNQRIIESNGNNISRVRACMPLQSHREWVGTSPFAFASHPDVMPCSEVKDRHAIALDPTQFILYSTPFTKKKADEFARRTHAAGRSMPRFRAFVQVRHPLDVMISARDYHIKCVEETDKQPFGSELRRSLDAVVAHGGASSAAVYTHPLVKRLFSFAHRKKEEGTVVTWCEALKALDKVESYAASLAGVGRYFLSAGVLESREAELQDGNVYHKRVAFVRYEDLWLDPKQTLYAISLWFLGTEGDAAHMAARLTAVNQYLIEHRPQLQENDPIHFRNGSVGQYKAELASLPANDARLLLTLARALRLAHVADRLRYEFPEISDIK